MRWRSVRLRLALLYGLVAFASGFGLLLVARLTIDQAVAAARIDVPLEPPADPRTIEQWISEVKGEQAAEEQAQKAALRTAITDAVTGRGVVVLAVVTAAGLAFGAFVADRTLRPLAAVTATTRRIAERTLHERIAVDGPDNEWRDLGCAVNAMLSRLDAAFAAQRQFVGNASHELKTPLAINRTLLEVAMDRPDAPADLVRLGENLMEVNVRHERLVDGLLTLIAAEHRIAAPRRVDLADVVGDAVAFLRPEADRRGLPVTVDLRPVEIDGDPTLLDRLVQNLVQNAIVHNVPDGWLRVEVGPTPAGARLVVVNTGPAVPAASVPALFEPFHRMANRVRSAKGNGLGLTIVRSVVNAHAGSVVARPREGGGLEVEVVLPSVG
jgi:signal transduction histidine kinase